eukprot:TRINITY_DN5449_c0_g1_i1.p2 TRINITY_DN5449_c0_g1~~TRINITY_DN5449_c0_g1_i1.p2  ORF type:complete len:238 (+),score=77.39 TRINITY_DN5449_c0_g1_i1:605-1318(+)
MEPQPTTDKAAEEAEQEMEVQEQIEIEEDEGSMEEVKETEPEKPPKEQGLVKKWNSAKGYGFLTLDSTGDDIFAHSSDVKSEGDGNLEVGTEVEFSIQTVGGKKKAIDITAPGGRALNAIQLGKSAGGPRSALAKGKTRGTVKKWFDTWKESGGFGFLVPSEGEHEGKDVYVHHAAFGGGSLNIGWEIYFDIEEDPHKDGKLRAVNVTGPAVCGRGCRPQVPWKTIDSKVSNKFAPY